MKPIIWLFFAHVVGILLAATGYTILTCLSDDVSFKWNFFQYAYEYGWGHVYQSRYGLLQVLTYVAAYSLGLPVFFHAWARGYRLLGISGAFLCLLGAISFVIESSHWVFNHNVSLIASSPLLIAILWIWWVAQEVIDSTQVSIDLTDT